MSFNQASTNLIEKQLDNGISTVYHQGSNFRRENVELSERLSGRPRKILERSERLSG